MANFYVTRLGIVVPALAALGILTAERATSESFNSQSRLSCAIEVGRSSGGIEMQAVVVGAAGNSGNYRLVVRKTGGGGSANIDQSGEFALGAGGSRELATVSLGGDGRYIARLSVSAGGRTAECTKNVSGAL
jgi:hypothetical protein